MITFYSTGCPKCQILKQKLDMKNLSYEIVSDMDTMIIMGLQSVPWIEVDGELMDFGQAVQWVNKQ